MSTKLYVGNLPYQTTESDLQELFAGSGSVASINVVRDRATGSQRGGYQRRFGKFLFGRARFLGLG